MRRLPALLPTYCLLLALLGAAPASAVHPAAAGAKPASGTTQVERIAGPDRISTATALSSSSHDRANIAVLARADDYADALAGAPLARALDAPILLSGSTHLPAATMQELRRLGADTVVLLGGLAALSRGVEHEARALGLRVRRIGGGTRFHTAGLIAEALADLTGPAECGYLARGGGSGPGQGWPDAIAVGALAAAEGRPLLLTLSDRLPDATLEAIDELALDCLTVVGGTAAISEAVVDQLRAQGVRPRRVAGATRFETAAKIADLAVASGIGGTAVYLATGFDFPDSLAAGPAVAKTRGVLLLVDGRDASPGQAAIEWLSRRQGISSIRIVGGERAVSSEFEEMVVQLKPQHPGLRPGPGSTGPRVLDGQLRPSGSVSVTDDGAVIEGLDISGTLVIDANDVVVRDTRVSGSAPYLIRAMPGTSGTLIEHVEVDGQYSLEINGCIQGPNVTVRHSELRRCTDGAKVGSGSVYEYNWIHDPTRDTSGSGTDGHGHHVDGLQSTGGRGIVIRGNHIDVVAADGHLSNSAIILKSDFGSITDCLIEGNWLNGGNYTIFLGEGKHGPPTGCVVRDNRFGRDYRYGLLSIKGEVSLSGNVWDHDGRSIDGL